MDSTVMYYQDGNTVKRANTTALPNRYTRMRELEEARAEYERHINKVRRTHTKKNRLATFYLLAVTIVCCVLFVGYVSLQNSVTTRLNNIANLQSQVNELKADNNAALSRIETNVNVADIKETALNDLGMVYADKSHIVYYQTENKDYMSQYLSIQ